LKSHFQVDVQRAVLYLYFAAQANQSLAQVRVYTPTSLHYVFEIQGHCGRGGYKGRGRVRVRIHVRCTSGPSHPPPSKRWAGFILKTRWMRLGGASLYLAQKETQWEAQWETR
jgi:hypothetical protein